jgi:hypothetical protein
MVKEKSFNTLLISTVYGYLNYVREHPGCQASDIIGMFTGATVYKMKHKLEAAGMITVKVFDGRTSSLYLTESGRLLTTLLDKLVEREEQKKSG